MITPKAGTLRHQVEIQQPVERRDAYGGVELDWQQVDIRWASVEPLSGREMWQAKQAQAKTSHHVKMRAQDLEIDPRMRLRYGERVLNIDGVTNADERGIMLDILCSEDV